MRNSAAVITAAALAATTVLGMAPDRAAAAPAPDCSTATPDTEWQRCVRLEMRLGSAPALGARADLTVTLTAQVDVAGVRVRLDLPDLLRWSPAPAGLHAARQASRVPSDYAAVTRATGTVSLRAGQPVVFRAGVTAVRTGSTVLRAEAVSALGAEYSDRVDAALTIGAAASVLGMPEGDDPAVAVPPDVVLQPASPHLPYRPGSTKGLPTPVPPDDTPDGTPGVRQVSCVIGSFVYVDNTGTTRAAKNLQFQAWDEDFGADDLLAAGLTDGNGAYRACFDGEDSTGGRGGQDVYVRAVAEGSMFRVEDFDDDAYAFRSATRDELGNGRTHDFGRLQTANPANMPAYHIFDRVDDAASFTPGQCWDERDTDCRNVDLTWEPGSTEGTFYDVDDDEVRLRGPDPDTPWVVLHELGHGVMDDVYDEDFPEISDDCARQHFVTRASDATCAWVEGFADWYGSAVLNEPDIPARGNIDTSTWDTPGWDDGDTVEGRVAGSLWDLDDAGLETWDTINDTLDNIWNTFLDHRATTFNEYWTQRGQDGRDVSDLALGALFQNTVDYGFRQPLSDGVGLVRPSPTVDHNYRYDTRFGFWSVVAMRPPANADYDLELFDDRDQTQSLESSVLGPGTTDFVAVDSNVGRRPLGDYYPRVRRLNGAGDYVVELADSGTVLPPTGTTRAMGANDVVAVWDVCLSANQQVTITVTPGDPSQDAELFLMRSQAGNPATHVRPRATAVAEAVGQGPGAAETFTYTAPEFSCHGLVLVNRAGAGTYTITRS